MAGFPRRREWAARGPIWVPAMVGIAFAGPAAAQHYDFDLTRFEFSGAGSFVDDFADGDRNAPPTDLIVDAFGTTSEEPGALRFTTADGADTFEPFNGSVATGFRDIAVLGSGPGNAFIDGAGPASYRTHWAGPPPELSGFDYDRQFFSHVSFVSAPRHIVLSVIQSAYSTDLTTDLAGATCQGDDPRVLMAYTQPFLVQLACDPFDPGDVTGDVVLEVSFDDAADTMSFAYSLDGGSTFVPSSTWQQPVASVLVSEVIQNSYAIAGMGASATRLPSQLPGPGIAVALFLLAAGWRAERRARRGRV